MAVVRIKESFDCPDSRIDLINKVITAINDEFKTIQFYNSLIEHFTASGNDDVVRVIKDINDEEHVHVGQLITVLGVINPGQNIEDIYKGSDEGIQQMVKESFDNRKTSLKEGYYSISINTLNDIRDRVDDLIEMMDDVGQSDISPDPNTYGIGNPFIGTYNGYIDLSNPEKYISDEDSEEYDESLSEDTVKKSNGKWTNRGDDGTEHGEFNTKKEADAQRKAMYANGYKG